MSNSRNIADSAPVINFIDGVTSNVQTQLDGKATYPSQSGNADKFLTTNGSAVSWADLPASGGVFTGTASGTIANGDKIVINTDGTISSVTGSQIQESISAQQSTGNTAKPPILVWDSYNNKIVAIYAAWTGSQGKVQSGTISGETITWSAQYEFSGSFDNNVVTACFVTDFISTSNINRVAIFYRDFSNGYGKMCLIDCSGATPTRTADNTYYSGNVSDSKVVYDPINKAPVLFYKRGGSYSSIGCIDGSLTTLNTYPGTYQLNSNSSSNYFDLNYDSTTKKCVAVYRDGNQSNYLVCRVMTVASNGGMTLSSEVVLQSSTYNYNAVSHDVESGLNLIIGQESSSTQYLSMMVDCSGVNPVVEVNPTAMNPQPPSVSAVTTNNIVYNPRLKNHIFFYKSNNKMLANVLSYNKTTTVTSNNAAFEVHASGQKNERQSLVYNPIAEKVMFGFHQNVDDNAVVYFYNQFETITNLTQNNWIGVSNAAYADGVSAEIKTRGSIITNSTFKDVETKIGTPSEFASGNAYHSDSAYDPDSDRYVFVYRSGVGSNLGYAVVAQATGTTLTYGTPVAFSTANAIYVGCTVDTNTNKVVIIYNDWNDNYYSVGKVGTINPSTNSITFGSATKIANEYGADFNVIFDTNTNRVVVVYTDTTNSSQGKAVVGQVDGSANTISFGTTYQINGTATCSAFGLAYSTYHQKFVVTYRDNAYGRQRARVGIVTGGSTNSITFGAQADVNVHQTHAALSYDPITYKMISIGRNVSTNRLEGNVLTIDGSANTISVGASKEVNRDSVTGNVAVQVISGSEFMSSFMDASDSDGYYTTAKISGTDIVDLSSAHIYSTSITSDAYPTIAYNSNTDTSVLGFVESSSTQKAFAVQFESSLSAGTSYLINFDGTIVGTTSDLTVPMGTALNSTTVFTKGI